MNQELAERLKRVYHAILPPDTIPLTAIRFLHWAQGNENTWAGLEQCLVEYIAASVCSRIREPLMFFGLHSNIDVFPTEYKKLFFFGAGYMPYNADLDTVMNEWQRASNDIHKPLPDTLKEPYLISLLILLEGIKHLFDNRRDAIQGRICVLKQKRERDASFFNPRPQYTEKQQAMLNRLHQYDVFIERIYHGDRDEVRLPMILENFDTAWSNLNVANEAAGREAHPNIQLLLDALDKVTKILTDAINAIWKIEKVVREHIHGK